MTVKHLLFVSTLVVSALAAEQARAQAPNLPRREMAHYKMTYGLLGQVGALTLSLDPARGGPPLVRAVGVGNGSLLGMDMARRIESDFDVPQLRPNAWRSTRVSGDRTVADSAIQVSPGRMSIVRRRAGQPDRAEQFQRGMPVLDPVGLLLRLRLLPPISPQRFEVLDGRALWVITVTPAGVDGTGAKFEGRAEPIFWDGSTDANRKTRTFSIWFSNDRDRTPLRLVMPYGPGELRADLVGLSRPKRTRIPWVLTPATFQQMLSSVITDLRISAAK